MVDNNFAEIRPYDDDEIPTVLPRLINNPEFNLALSKMLFPKLPIFVLRWIAPFIAAKLLAKTTDIKDIATLQAYIKPYLIKNITSTSSAVTFSGIENLCSNQPYLFISNHRDIVMDPAIINYLLDMHNHTTPRLAIGDNLLGKDFIADLMRLNKSFIVKRNIKNKREKLANAKLLAEYIYHSLTVDKSSVWIAQAEGRAKNGNDKTNSALIKMLNFADTNKDFAQFIKQLNIVPVSISYEFDPCDSYKARELYAIATTGNYVKKTDEDEKSIAQGVMGHKGKIHVHFASDCQQKFTDVDSLVHHIDKTIHQNYHLFATNYTAYAMWENHPDDLKIPSLHDLFSAQEIELAKRQLQQRLAKHPKKLHQFIIMQYAYPVLNYYSV